MAWVLLTFALLMQTATARERYIVGGAEVTNPDSWPWQGSLKASGGNHTCGCVLAHESWVLTAAHCLSGNDYTVEFGMLELGQGTEYRIQSYAIHPNYNDPSFPGSYPNDIAVLRSAQIEGAYILPVDLTVGADLSNNPSCWVTGWGRLDGGGELPTTLNEVNIPVETDATCKALLNTIYNADVHICAYDSEEQSKGHCNGDNGGPLVCMQDGIWRLEGIASWHMSNCSPAMPSVYTRIEAMKTFICDATIGMVAPEYCTPITGPTPPNPPTDPPKKA